MSEFGKYAEYMENEFASGAGGIDVFRYPASLTVMLGSHLFFKSTENILNSPTHWTLKKPRHVSMPYIR